MNINNFTFTKIYIKIYLVFIKNYISYNLQKNPTSIHSGIATRRRKVGILFKGLFS